jgi:predicted unusual protein kinase regulating ubiquinone biosynthesis (AarF/ABC1/UbiB family)
MLEDIKSEFLERNLSYVYRKFTDNILCKILKIYYIFLTSSFKFLFNFNRNKLIINIAELLAKENPIYVKILQSICINCNLFNKTQIEYLLRFTDNVPYHESEINFDFLNTLAIIGTNNPEYNISISTIPINVGTIGIVFKGTMGYSRKEVIIKVVKQNIHQKLQDALNIASYIVCILSYLPYIKHLNLHDVYRENYDLLMNQTNFLQELNNINDFRELNKNIDNIIIPNTYDIFTQKNNDIIVMDFIFGEKITNICRDDCEIYANLLNIFSIKSILFDSKYHADMHAGNILFIKDEIVDNEIVDGIDNEIVDGIDNKKYSYKIGIIDFGIIGSITREQQNKFYEFIHNICNDKVDYCQLTQCVINNFIEPENILANLNIKELNTLTQDLESILISAFEISKNFEINDMYKINYLLSKYNLKLKRYFCKIQMSFFICSNINYYLYNDNKYIDKVKALSEKIFNVSLLSL